jgi:hypothetical protein
MKSRGGWGFGAPHRRVDVRHTIGAEDPKPCVRKKRSAVRGRVTTEWSVVRQPSFDVSVQHAHTQPAWPVAPRPKQRRGKLPSATTRNERIPRSEVWINNYFSQNLKPQSQRFHCAPVHGHVLRKIIIADCTHFEKRNYARARLYSHVFTVYRYTKTFLRKIIMRPQFRAGDPFVSCRPTSLRQFFYSINYFFRPGLKNQNKVKP